MVINLGLDPRDWDIGAIPSRREVCCTRQAVLVAGFDDGGSHMARTDELPAEAESNSWLTNYEPNDANSLNELARGSHIPDEN